MMQTKFMAHIGNDPIDNIRMVGCETAEQAAQSARRYAEMGEIITVIGPRGGRTNWKAVGGGAFGGVWKV